MKLSSQFKELVVHEFNWMENSTKTMRAAKRAAERAAKRAAIKAANLVANPDANSAAIKAALANLRSANNAALEARRKHCNAILKASQEASRKIIETNTHTIEVKIPGRFRDTWFSTTAQVKSRMITYTDITRKAVSFEFTSFIGLADRLNKRQNRINFFGVGENQSLALSMSSPTKDKLMKYLRMQA